MSVPPGKPVELFVAARSSFASVAPDACWKHLLPGCYCWHLAAAAPNHEPVQRVSLALVDINAAGQELLPCGLDIAKGLNTERVFSDDI